MTSSPRIRRPSRSAHAAVLVSIFALASAACSGGPGSILTPEGVGQRIQPAAGGCSLTAEPEKNAVEYAAGFVALVASLVGLRRRLRPGAEEPLDGDGTASGHRPRMPSMP
jgi:hypothetical protein